jgi:hypothetical protein
MWAVHNAAVRSVGLGRLTDNLYRICIPLNQLATATFMVREATSVLGDWWRVYVKHCAAVAEM